MFWHPFERLAGSEGLQTEKTQREAIPFQIRFRNFNLFTSSGRVSTANGDSHPAVTRVNGEPDIFYSTCNTAAGWLPG